MVPSLNRRPVTQILTPAGNDGPHRDDAERGQAAVDAHFTQASGFWDELYHGTDVYSAIHRLRRDIALRWIDELDLPAGARVLELGCGAGFMAVALARRGLRVHATDA